MSDIKNKRKLPTYIVGDDLSLKISSYPIFLSHLCERFGKRYSVLLELCTGIGVGLIFLEKAFDKLYGIELDPVIVQSAKTNIFNAGLKDKISIIQGNVNNISEFSYIKPDVVIYDIPFWSDHDANLLKQNPDFKSLFEKINKNLTNDIIVYSPTSFDYIHYKNLLGVDFELEEIYIGNRHDRNVLYFGKLINRVGISQVFLDNQVT